MTGAVAGALLGAVAGTGGWLVLDRALALRRISVSDRVLPYLRDLTVAGDQVPTPTMPTATGLRDALRPLLSWIGARVDRVFGGSGSVQRRLQRANLPLSVHEFRIEQAVWGLVAFTLAAIPAMVLGVGRPDRGPALMVLCLTALVVGVLLRENRLTAQVAKRERRVLEELPLIAELLALAVAAGESPMAALDRVVRRSHGEFAHDLSVVLAQVRTGTPLISALDELAARSGLAPVSRFAHGMAIAIERGTPLADVLHAQAGDVRDAARRALIETGARREVLMMVPVVFLILPTVVVFAFWPGLVGLRLVVP